MKIISSSKGPGAPPPGGTGERGDGHGLKWGDAVLYVPHEAHATIKGDNGDYPWKFGVALPGQTRRGGEGEEERFRELTTKEAEDVLTFIRRHPNPAEERKKLFLLRPVSLWPAVVSAVNEDGTVDVDVASHRGGVTLHLPGLEVAGEDEPWTPHTVRTIQAGDENRSRDLVHARLREALPAPPAPPEGVSPQPTTPEDHS